MVMGQFHQHLLNKTYLYKMAFQSQTFLILSRCMKDFELPHLLKLIEGGTFYPKLSNQLAIEVLSC